MKIFALSLGLLLAVSLSSCRGTSQIDNAGEAPSEDSAVVEVPDATIPDTADAESLEPETAEVTPQGFPFAVSTFTSTELIDANAGGCGMSLWRAGESPVSEGILFFSGVEETALMMFDDELQQLNRTEASGEAFYGQQNQQTFATIDGEAIVRVSVTLGELGEIESVGISDGTIAVEAQGIATEIPVVGDAGC